MNTNTQPQTTIDASSAKDAVLLYGHSHNSDAKSGPDYDATQIAKKYLKKLDEAMKDIGYATLVGLEIETKDNINYRMQGYEDKSDLRPFYGLEDANTFDRLYLDGQNAEVTTLPSCPSHAADSANKLKRLITEKNTQHNPEWWRLAGFNTSNDVSPIGTHINISLHQWHDGLSEKDLIEGEQNKTYSPMGIIIKDAINSYHSNDSLALYDGSNIIKRFQEHPTSKAALIKHSGFQEEANTEANELLEDYIKRNGSSTGFALSDTLNAMMEKYQKSMARIENPYPSAGCNDYLATLSTLSIAYLGTCNQYKEGATQTSENIFAPINKKITTSSDTLTDLVNNFAANSPTLLAMETLAKHAKTPEEAKEIREDAKTYTKALIDRAHMIDHAMETGEKVIDIER